MPTETSKQINELIGQRIFQRRVDLRITAQNFAKELGISWQKLDRYESGKADISASMLIEISYQLQMPLHYFLAGGTCGDKALRFVRESYTTRVFK